MNFIARFEYFIERLMERSFTRAAGSHLQPVEIGKRLARVMESQQSVGIGGVMVPNIYDVYLSPDDYAEFESVRGSMARELESHLGRVSRQRRLKMVSRPVVHIRPDRDVNAGDVLIESHMQDIEPETPANIQHTAVLPAIRGSAPGAISATPNLRLNGDSYAVLRSPTRLGRLPDNDIVLNDKRVSRHHAEVVERKTGWVVRDTGSTNGTALNGKLIKEAPLKPGDTISLGGLEVIWEQ